MKKYKLFIILGVSGLLGLSSCNDFLDVNSPSHFDSGYVFSSTGDAKKAVLGAYALFTQDTYTSRMSAVWMQNTDVEVQAPSANPDGSRRDIWSLQGGRLSGFSDIYNAWQDNYLAIDRANQCIEGILASSIKNDPEMQTMLGESYCIRAYRYFLLCNFWGDVPYFREAAKAGMQLDVPKTDKNYIYTDMIQDLINGEENMYFADQYSADGIERMNREFALGMIARIALFRAGYGTTADGSMKRADDYMDVSGDDKLAVTYTYNGVEKTARTSSEYYQLAKDYCQKLISLKDRPLNSNFATIFKNQCEWKKPLNDDILFEVAFGDKSSGGDVGWCVGVAVSASSKGSTTIQVGLTPSYYYSFDQKDLRRDATVSKVSYRSDTEQVPQNGSALTVAKWNRLWLTNDPGQSSSKGTGINWPLMRYSDILLMLAEAENELNGPTQLAKDALKRVRERAFASADHADKVAVYLNGLSSKQDFFNAIVDERAWEFGGEGLRKFDLGRWNIYGLKIVETKKIIDLMGQAAYEQNLDNPEVAKYADYADVLYYQRVNGTVVFLNDYYKATNPPLTTVEEELVGDEGYENAYGKINWTKQLYKKIENKDGSITYESADYTVRCWRGYLDVSGLSAVPYLVPISTRTTSVSDYLTNDGYGLVLN